ncbi:hypothetical protein E1A91_A13G237500v1 [Gossypium mustelinum]|uniref:2-oxoglutarate-dependent dioxygenase DAO n=1 Tax=Gossypium mustelinum TaxID=34275 RepID=A0A5D2WLL7_GOSMU|nr:hypothetical protein E1A91_A13G237500v1 [Gossypium mustelinum]
MAVDAEIVFPVIEFHSSDLERGTEGWNRLCKRVREACETFGCFEVVYEKISKNVREDVFGLLKELFDVPVERKQKNTSPIPFHGWVGPCKEISLLYEGFGLGDASNYDSIKSFAQVIWPDGHPHFCDIMHTMTTQMEELNKLIWLMIIDSYELGNRSLDMNYKTLMRMMKYIPPQQGEYESGLFAHTDKPLSTLICEHQIPGLEIEVNDGQWIKLFNLSPSSFVFVVGDTLKAWSNGRLKAVTHRVMMNEGKDRYSMSAFAVPNENTIIKAPKELIDEQHPQLYKDFDFKDYLLFVYSDPKKRINSGQQIDAFAALSPPASN